MIKDVDILDAYMSKLKPEPCYASSWRKLARAFEVVIGHEAAVHPWDVSVNLDPCDLESRVGYSSCLLGARKYPRAREVISQAGEHQPESSAAVFHIGWVYNHCHDLPESQRSSMYDTCLKKALKLALAGKCVSDEDYYCASIASNLLDKVADVVIMHDWNAAFPDSAKRYNALGKRAESSGEHDSALRCYMKAADLDRSNSDYVENVLSYIPYEDSRLRNHWTARLSEAIKLQSDLSKLLAD